MSVDSPSGGGVAGYRRLFTPITIGNVEVRNRILNPTHATSLTADREIEYFAARARGGVGLIGLEAHQGVASFTIGTARESLNPAWDERPVSPLSAAGIKHYDDVVIPALKLRSDAIHANGAHCYAQVHHPGAAGHADNIYPPVSPSGVRDPYESHASHVLTEEEIEGLVFTYAQGVRRIREAGLDAAEIHAAHGYLMTQFLSPATNHRTDKWGGSRGNRVRFALSVIAESRKLVGDDFPIGIRVGVDGDGAERGLTREELADICAIIAPHVAFVSVSGGNYAGFGAGHELAYVSPWYEPPGSNVESARLIKAQCDVPIFVTGRIADPSIAEGILADGAADMIGMVRALVADPDMPRKVRDGHPERVRMCLSVSECHYIGPHRKPMNCAVNASAGREAEMVLVPASVPRTVIVVGAGPAGMEAARVSAERGHTVYLADRARQLGGTPAVLAMDPNRHNLRDQVAYFALELSRLGVTLLLGNEVTAEEILEFGPDVVVVATGGVQIVPDVPGVAGSHVFRGLDVLGGASIPQDRVIVVAGLDKGIAAGTVAEFLADEGKSVQLVSEQVNFAPGVEDGTRLHLLDRLLKKGVEISQFHRLERVTDDGAALVNIFTRGERTCSDTAVVLACGLVPDDHLFRALNGKVPVHAVGDALAPRRIAHATLDGARVARAI